MTAHRVSHWCYTAIAVAAMATNFGLDKTVAAPPPPPADAEQGTEVLTRGPVHEAFAETVTFDPDAGVVVPKAPPQAIEELPPEQRLDGDNVAWIPGYWAWDDERNDFLWVSGIWRDLPPGRQWVAGYWNASGQGSQWISGYWADADAGENEYLPEPPESVEVGPNTSAPSPDQAWLPGSWIWQQNRYAWRPGFWSTMQPNWDWVPDHYSWTPRGYVFVDGYWDHSMDRRGILFAPVYFNSSVYGQSGFSYSPSMMVDMGMFSDHLFLRPRYGHYYFGDYYAASYSDAGFYPWFSFGHRGYDPFYAHQRWNHRKDRDWERNVKANFTQRRDHEGDRPPRTWMPQKELIGKGDAAKQSRSLVSSFDQSAKSKDGAAKFVPLDKPARQQLSQHGQELQKFRGERQKLETKADVTPVDPGSKATAAAKARLPKSPIVGKPQGQLGKDSMPPKRHEFPKPDLKIEPKVRSLGGNAQLPKAGNTGGNVRSLPERAKVAPKTEKEEQRRN